MFMVLMLLMNFDVKLLALKLYLLGWVSSLIFENYGYKNFDFGGVSNYFLFL